MQNSSHILVIRLSALGDVAMTVPVLRSVAKEYPHLKFTVLTRKFFAPLYDDVPNTEVFEAEVEKEHKGLPGLKKLADQLRAEKIDAVADLHNVLRSKILKRFFRFHGIPVKQINKGRAEKKALTRKQNKVFKPLKTTNQRYADVFEALGFPVSLGSYSFPGKIKLSENVRAIAGTEPKKWLGIAPFAQHSGKMYPIDLMEEVLQMLENHNLKIFLFGAGEEEKRILKIWGNKFRYVEDMAGRVSFKEELALISNLDAMLSMDSGNGHIAANYGIPVITLWGLTHPYAGFAPFGQPKSNWLLPDLQQYPLIPTSIYGNDIPAGYEAAIRTITPTMVVNKIVKLLWE